MTDRDDLAARMFPDQWARVATVEGKRAGRARHKLRQRAELELIMRPLREAGASCSSCTAFVRNRHGKGFICDDESVGGTYTTATTNGLCPNWRLPGQLFPRHSPVARL